MNKFRKAISVGMSAALVASLFTVIAAGTVFGATTVTSVGNVPRGGSATGFAITLTESSAACLADAAGSVTITLNDAGAAAPEPGVSFTGTPAVAAPGSLGATASVAANVLTISWDGSDTANVESVTVSGLGVSALVDAGLGAIETVLAGVDLACFQAGGTASGTIASGIAIGATSVIVNVTTPGCLFVATGAPPPPGQLAFAQNAESVNITGVAAGPGIGQQTLTIAATTAVHDAATAVSQTEACVASGVLSAAGTVVDSLIYNAPAQPTVVPGENNQAAGDLSVTERTVGFLSAGTTLTWTIATAGVTFSDAPACVVTVGDAVLTSAVAALSPDVKSATCTIATASTALSTVTLDSIEYDVAASVAAGTAISVGLVASGSKVVTPTSRSNAIVGRVLVGVGATPTIYIGENNQASGLITVTEAGPGFFTDGTGSNNVFGLCLRSEETFTLTPWAVVTAGDVRLREGAVASPDNIVLGTTFTGDDLGGGGGDSCVYWTVWTASTTASVIEIRATDPAAPAGPLASGPTNGPRLSVGPSLAPGTTQAGIRVGTFADVTDAEGGAEIGDGSLVVFAVRAFRSGVVVAAVSQPSIPRGSTGSAAGNITITETLAGQLKAGEEICVVILPRTNQPTIQDTFLLQATQNQLPVLATTGGGLAVGPVNAFMEGLCFVVTQQSVGTLGVITISNINYITTADAINGPVLVNVFKDGGPGVDFEAVVSNAKIGAVSVAEATINAGLNTRTGFGFGTEIVNRGAYVTIRSRASGSAPGDLVQIWVKTKTTPWMLETSRRVSPNGFMYYSGKVLNSGYRYYRVMYVAQGSISNTVRAYGR